MENHVYIYVIKCPATGLVRYVGKTNDPKYRFRKHLTENNKTYKSKWVKGLRSQGLKPDFEIIDECAEPEWEQREIGYIRLFKALGANLLNQARGGEGGATMLGRKLTDEQRHKITLSKIGKPNPGAAKSNQIHKGFQVNQFDTAGNLIATYPSINEAAKAINRNSRRIWAMVTGSTLNNKTVNHVAGYRFSKAV